MDATLVSYPCSFMRTAHSKPSCFGYYSLGARLIKHPSTSGSVHVRGEREVGPGGRSQRPASFETGEFPEIHVLKLLSSKARVDFISAKARFVTSQRALMRRLKDARIPSSSPFIWQSPGRVKTPTVISCVIARLLLLPSDYDAIATRRTALHGFTAVSECGGCNSQRRKRRFSCVHRAWE